MAKRLLLVRHGESIWNAEGRWQGSADPPLSDIGRMQAGTLAAFLAPDGIDSAISSDLDRARETAQIVCDALGLAAPTIDVGWRERDVGEISGHTREEIEAKWPGLLERWRQGEVDSMPGGEPDITPRVTAALARAAAAPGACTLVLTHGGVIGAIDRHLGQDYVRCGNVQGRWLDVADDGAVTFADYFGVTDLDDKSQVAL